MISKKFGIDEDYVDMNAVTNGIAETTADDDNGSDDEGDVQVFEENNDFDNSNEKDDPVEMVMNTTAGIQLVVCQLL